MINITLGIIVTIGAFVLLGLALWAEKGPAQKNAAANEKKIEALQSFDCGTAQCRSCQSYGIFE